MTLNVLCMTLIFSFYAGINQLRVCASDIFMLRLTQTVFDPRSYMGNYHHMNVPLGLWLSLHLSVRPRNTVDTVRMTIAQCETCVGNSLNVFDQSYGTLH